jgi:D-amino-acid dehydrogenase
MDDVIVIGGGLVGASVAYALARAGARATLVDRDDAGQATAAGAGIIAPGSSPRATREFLILAHPASAYYPQLLAQLAEDGATEPGYEVVGMLHVATSAEEASRLPAFADLLRERRASGFGHIGEVAQISGDEARELFPALSPEIVSAIHTSAAARVDGRLLRDALRQAAERQGARIISGEARLVRESNRAASVTVGGERLVAGAVVLAGGAWSAALGEALGMILPVSPQRGQILHLELPAADTSRWPIIQGFHSHYLLTFPRHRVVVGATRESEAGFDPRVTVAGLHEVVGEALRVAPGLADATLRETRVGLRPASPDGLPILGRAPEIENVYLATGHGPSGLQLGPYSGTVVADLALGRPAPTALDLTPFAPERFAVAGF